MYSASGHPRCRWVCSFMETDLQKCIPMIFHHLLTNGSSAVNGCRQNESKQLIKTSQVIHTAPLHQLTSCKVKSNEFVRNNSIETFLTSDHRFQLKYESIIMFPPVKKWSGLNQERYLHRSSTVYKPKQSKTALNKYVGGLWC